MCIGSNRKTQGLLKLIFAVESILPFLTGLALFVSAISCNKTPSDEKQLFSDVDTITFSNGETVHPFSYIKPNEKGWKVVIEISGDDLENGSHNISGRKLSSNASAVLTRISQWAFTYEGGDLATVTSSIVVYKDETLVDQHGIVLNNETIGLQSIKYGWITPKNPEEIITTIRLMEQKSFD